MGNFCARSDTEDSQSVAKITIGQDYQEFPEKIAGTGVKATPAWQATITRAQLNSKREEFWRSRSEGKRRTWIAIKAAVEADPATALSILQNSKIKMKTGNLSLLEDEEGNLYSIPIFMINNPISFHKEKKHKGRVAQTDQESIKLKIRRPGKIDDDEVEILNSAKVDELRKTCADKAQVQPAQIRLFFGGKEMKDHSTLASLFIVDGVVIQIFIKSL
jgi:hypothetical protein